MENRREIFLSPIRRFAVSFFDKEGIMGFIEVLNPVAEARAPELPLAQRVADLRGKTIGFLNNRKANAGLLLQHVEEILRSRFGEFSVVKGDKNAAMAASEKIMARLSHCDVVVTAIGD
jgi:hypothetical protein